MASGSRSEVVEVELELTEAQWFGFKTDLELVD